MNEKTQIVFPAVSQLWTDLNRNLPCGTSITTTAILGEREPYYEVVVAPSHHPGAMEELDRIIRLFLMRLNAHIPTVDAEVRGVDGIDDRTPGARKVILRHSEKNRYNPNPSGMGVPPGQRPQNTGWFDPHGSLAYPFCSPSPWRDAPYFHHPQGMGTGGNPNAPFPQFNPMSPPPWFTAPGVAKATNGMGDAQEFLMKELSKLTARVVRLETELKGKEEKPTT